MATFETRTIEEVTQTLIDYRGKTPQKAESGVRLITAKVIKDGFIKEERSEYISEETYASWMRRGYPQQFDIVLTTEAPLGEVAQLRTTERIALAQRVILLRGKPGIIDQQFFFQTLKSPFVQARLQQRATGTTVLGIKQSELRQVSIPYFPLSTQRKIAAILSAYDDLIENNLRRIKILEEMAQNLYQEWFVKFRFPGHSHTRFVDSALGQIPEGWEVMKIREVADVNARSIRKDATPSEIVYIDIASVSSGTIDKMEIMAFADAPGRARRITTHGDIIWSSVRPNRRSFSLIINPPKNLIVSTGFAVISAKRVPFTYLYQVMTTDDFVVYLVNHAKGAAYPAVSADDFENANILVPSKQLLNSFDNKVLSIAILVHRLKAKNTLLRRTRDLLLPKLISGELDVSALDITVPAEVDV